jgi:FHS family L-fucose permease-like MFS transporter
MEFASGDREGAVRAPGWMAYLVAFLFFAWGFATVLNDILIPKLKGLFSLSYTEAGLVQSAFFIAYFFVSLPAGFLLARIGYLRGMVVGLLVMAAGCLMFVPAAQAHSFAIFLGALFVMAGGITILQVAANPFMAVLGDPKGSHSRLTAAQTANSFGTMIGPYVGSAVILGAASAPAGGTAAPADASSVIVPYMTIGAVLIVFAAIFWAVRKQVTSAREENPPGFADTFALLRRPRVGLGALSIFLYVGAEVAIGSYLVNYLAGSAEHPGVLGVTEEEAGKMVAIYWGAAFVGRLIGTFLLRKFPAGRLLSLFAIGASLLVIASIASTGQVAAATILAVGLFNSIMFPTIFTLAIEGLGKETGPASGLLCMAIVGGAVIPPLTGQLADQMGLGMSFLLPVACYVWIFVYGLMSSRKTATTDLPASATPPPTGV